MFIATRTDFTLQLKALPAKLPIKKLGTEYKALQGYVKLANFSRLSELIKVQNNEQIWVNLEFVALDTKKILINGHIDHDVTLECQRCLQYMIYKINTKISVVLIDILSRIDKNLSAYEPIEIDIKNNDKLDLYQLIEDEMILSLPTVAMHSEHQLDICEINELIIH